MDMTFDHASLFATDPIEAVASGQGVLPDWDGLKARFLAAHALRQEVARKAASQIPGGSFTIAALALRATRGSASTPVNPNVSANGKPPGAMAASFAEIPRTASEDDYD